MGGQQPGMPHSPRDPEDYSMDVDGPSDNPGYVSLFIEVCNHVTLIWVAGVEWL
jgi:potassium/chloride transporter 4/5/6